MTSKLKKTQAEKERLAYQEFRDSLPGRMAKMQAAAKDLGWDCEVTLTPVGPTMTIIVDEYTVFSVNYADTDSHVRTVEQYIASEVADRKSSRARYAAFQDLLATLTPEQRRLLCEFRDCI